jgi:hypothetical protein
MHLPTRRTIFAFAVFSFLPALAACPKKDPPAIVDPPPPPPEPEAGPVDLAPIEEDAGEDVDAAEAGPKKYTGTYNPNVARLKQCCGALRAEAKRMGASPEAGMFLQAAASCDGLAAQAGAKGTAPELGVVRNLLAGRTVPPVCRGF